MRVRMGFKSHSIENLGPPFLIADEMVLLLPKNGEIVITLDQFKILFVLKGKILHELDGIAGRVPFEQGDILLCPGFNTHRYINPDPGNSAPLHVMRLFLDGEAIRRQSRKRNKQPEHDLTEYIGHHFTKNLQIKDGIDSEITGYLNELRRETERREVGARHRARSLCTDLVIAVSRRLSEVNRQESRRSTDRAGFIVTSAKEYILKNLDTRLTLGEIAWHTQKGEEHLARVFKRETGQSVFDFVREMRINQAKTDLLNSSLSLTEIAEKTGFSSLSFFSRSFKDLVGIPPSAYRQYTETTLQPFRKS